jgi:hypothetical protein
VPERLSPELRTLRAQLAAHTRWANTDDPVEATAPARKAFNDRFEKQVDPDGVLDPEERARRAESARKAHFTRMAFKSARARQEAAAARKRIASGSGGEAA